MYFLLFYGVYLTNIANQCILQWNIWFDKKTNKTSQSESDI